MLEFRHKSRLKYMRTVSDGSWARIHWAKIFRNQVNNLQSRTIKAKTTRPEVPTGSVKDDIPRLSADCMRGRSFFPAKCRESVPRSC